MISILSNSLRRAVTRAAASVAFVTCFSGLLPAQTFVHPGGLHTLADLDRMKTNVLAGNHPWIDGWNVLVTDAQAQSNYASHATSDFNANRQNADADAHAAYLNTIRWYISSDINFANTATNILNKWAATVTTNSETGGGLSGLPTMSFALAGELLRAYSGWKTADFAAFTNLMGTYLYPPCSNFISSQSCNFAHWTSWDSPSAAAIAGIGILCDDANKFNQAVNFYKNGASGTGYGAGAISNAVPFLYGALGQTDESGRDQEHCTLGIADLGVLCQEAWNQGVDLFGYANNRLLAGIEYVARYNLSHDEPYTGFNDCSGNNLFFVSNDGRGRIDDRPVYEMFYNHYVVQQGLTAPNITAMARLYRPERGSADHFGYGTLTYTLSPAASPYPATPAPLAPVALTAQAGLSKVILNWSASPGDWAQGYNVLRATTSRGPYTTIASWTANTLPSYTDTSVTAGTTYYYVVSAVNVCGASLNSAEVSGTPMAAEALPAGWTRQDIGVVTNTGTVQYSSAGDSTFNLVGAGTGIGGTADGGFAYSYRIVTNDFTMVARLAGFNADQMGLMMRGSLATNSAEVQFLMANNARQSVFGYRNGNGANLNHYNYGDQFTYAPAWYRLSRSGNNFTASQSADGINWSNVVTVTVSSIPASGYYVGLAINNGNASFDNVVFTNAAVTGAFAPPASPASLTATAVDSNQVYLAWAPTAGACGYNVYRSTVSGGGYSLLAPNVSASGWYDSTVAASTAYFYVVTAINGGGESANSTETAVTTPASQIPKAPAGVTATPTTSQITLNWNAVIGARSYNVKRSLINGGPFTTIASGIVANYIDSSVGAGTNYYYVITAVNSAGESANSSQVLGLLLNKLGGTIIGTSGSYGNQGNTITNVFDGKLNTFFDGPDASGDWCGLDLGAGVTNVVGAIQFCPRPTWASRMVGGVFQGANDSGFTNPTTLFTVTTAPTDGVMNTKTISMTNVFRYVRYLGPNNGWCNVAEIEFDGRAPLLPPPSSPWPDVDIGTVGMAGSANYSNGTFTIQGAGSDIGTGADSFNFAYQTLTNDGTIYARIASVINGGKVGVMMRATTNANSVMAAALLDFAQNNARFATRTTTGNWPTWQSSGTLSPLTPNWVKVTRSGNSFSGYYSADGINWTPLGTNVSITMNSTIQVGIGVASYSTATLSTCTLDNVYVTNGVAAPAAPTGLSATAGDTQIALAWAASSGATSYNVKRATVNGGPYTTITNVATTSYTDTDVANGTTYYYVVSALNTGGESANSAQVTATPQVAAPVAPTGLVGTAGDTQVALVWNASSGATSYNVKRATVSGGPYTTITNVAATSYTDTGVANGSTYYYVVSASNAGGESANSAEASATPQVAVPAAPTGLAAVPGNQQAVLSWSASAGAISYNVKRSTTSGTGYVTVTNVTGIGAVDVALANGTTYYYVVSALNAGGESANSAEVAVIPTDLFGWWKFDSTSGTVALDSSSGNNGTLSSGATWISGVLSNAVHVDGSTNGYVSLPSGLVSNLADFSVATWVKVDTNATWARVFDFGTGTGVYMFLAPASGGGTVRYAITTSSSNGEQQLNSSSVLSPGIWHHLAVTLSGSTGTLYVDGVAVSTNTSMTLKPSSLGSTAQNYLGKSQWNDPYLNGSLDDFRLYSRALSAAEVATLAGAGLPSPWATSDIGAVNATGAATLINGAFTVQGAGTNILGTADAFRFLYQSASADCSNTVRVATFSGTNVNARAGVVIRESLAANAREAGIWLTPSSGVIFTCRSSTGGSTSTSKSSGKAAPYWVRIARVGNVFSGYYSADGVSWTQLGSKSINMATSTYIGMGVNSGVSNVLTTATMDNNTIVP